jgi:hypothetical protein
MDLTVVYACRIGNAHNLETRVLAHRAIWLVAIMINVSFATVYCGSQTLYIDVSFPRIRHCKVPGSTRDASSGGTVVPGGLSRYRNRVTWLRLPDWKHITSRYPTDSGGDRIFHLSLRPSLSCSCEQHLPYNYLLALYRAYPKHCL